MSNMVFCRGCGKAIHESAPACPHCGATQTATVPAAQGSKWMTITALVLGAMTFLAGFGLLDEGNASAEGIVGVFAFAIPSIVLAAISLSQRRWGKSWAITAIVLSALGILLVAGA
ncbi:zinc-ribbon domain protein [Bordetella bronchiseptica 99-R-0433]|uniref:zinc ribbon domain-containing protein n=1 Tax=Bordetella bronchiseptica TaxID=518 RepID=UPI00045A966A|nr:zinc ribbon domain-containing protein [Bordetella bronchiseptica]KCV59251.1 zinc-ribbon domain protein [Bordetella bronchiseptica 99-R-0433]